MNSPSFLRPVPAGYLLRLTREEDIPALVTLRRGLLSAMRLHPEMKRDAWESAMVTYLREGFSSGNLRGVGAMDGENRMVACALGACEPVLPWPGNVRGVRGHLMNVATEPAHRGRGLATACSGAVLAWFDEFTAVTSVTLDSTPEATPIYERFGFRVSACDSLVLPLSPSRPSSR